ncbi:MAG: ATP-binding protein [Elusimicrobia bacterium]|nr:ATP-binding protein [Elusimicrobiota bacterium]
MPEAPQAEHFPGSSAYAVPSLVKDLVDQFDRPLDFLRELAQNSIDAGSNRIDVSLEYVQDPAAARALDLPPPAPGGGYAVIRVEDDGEGMDERTIDDYLLVLFRSTKEEDFTKIGKFGIGFVSVLALRPERVRVHTCRSGESWRLDFPDYKSYEKFLVPELREGTLVELVKVLPRESYAELAAQARAALVFWCKHSEARIYFRDRSSGEPASCVTEPFDLPGGASLRYEEEGTEILFGFTAEEKPFCGFYNRGLTLKEARQVLIPGVELKVKSRYIEHTLTRDNVLEDANYGKLMKRLKRAARSELSDKLRKDLEDIALRLSRLNGAPSKETQALEEAWRRRLPFLRWLFAGYFSRWKRSDWAIFPGLCGRVYSLKAVRKAAGDAGRRVFFDSAPNNVTKGLQSLGVPVLIPGQWVELAAAWASARAEPASQAFILPRVLPEEGLPGAHREFLQALRRLDADSGAKYRGILAADFNTPGSSIQGRLFTVQEKPGSLSAADQAPVSSLFLLPRARRWALLHAGHPAFTRLCRLHAAEPGLAAYLCLKIMRLHDGEVPHGKMSRYCNLAEKAELRLLQAALRAAPSAGHSADGTARAEHDLRAGPGGRR